MLEYFSSFIFGIWTQIRSKNHFRVLLCNTFFAVILIIIPYIIQDRGDIGDDYSLILAESLSFIFMELVAFFCRLITRERE